MYSQVSGMEHHVSTYHEMFVSNDVLLSRLDRKKDRDGQLGSELPDELFFPFSF